MRKSEPALPLLAFLVGLIAFLTFASALRNGFVSDDQILIEARIPDYRAHFPFPEAFTQSFWKGSSFDLPRPGEEKKDYYRPLTTLSYALDVRIWGERAFGYHLTNALLHAACSALLVLYLGTLGFGALLAAAGGLVFACHPVHASSVAWIAGRTDLLAALFLFAALFAFARHRAATTRGFRPTGAFVVSLVAYLAALLSKEIAIVLLPLLLAEAVARKAGSEEPPGASVRWPLAEAAILAGVTLLYVAFRAVMLGIPDFQAGSITATSAFRLGMTPAVYAYYWRVLLWPGTLHFHVPLALPSGPADPRFLLTALFLLAQLLAGIWLLRRAPWAAFGLFWYLISLVPVSHLIPLAFKTVVAEYWAYVPSVALVLLLAGLAQAWSRGRPERTSRAAAALAALGVLGAVALPARSAVYRTEEGLLRHTVSVYPGHADSWVTLAAELGERGDYDEAFRAARTALRVDPKARGAWGNLGNLYDAIGRPDSAEVAYRRELAVFPWKDDVKINLADVLLRRGEDQAAADLYREAIAARADNREFLPQRAAVLEASARDGRATAAERREQLGLASGVWAAYLLAEPEGVASQGTRALELAMEAGALDRARRELAAGYAAQDPRRTAWLAILNPGDSIAAASAPEASRVAGWWWENGDTEPACALYGRLLASGSIGADPLVALATQRLRATERPGYVGDAAGLFSTVLAREPENPFALLNLGSIAESRGDRSAARSHWSRFLARYPERPEAGGIRDRLARLGNAAGGTP